MPIQNPTQKTNFIISVPTEVVPTLVSAFTNAYHYQARLQGTEEDSGKPGYDPEDHTYNNPESAVQHMQRRVVEFASEIYKNHAPAMKEAQQGLLDAKEAVLNAAEETVQYTTVIVS